MPPHFRGPAVCVYVIRFADTRSGHICTAAPGLLAAASVLLRPRFLPLPPRLLMSQSRAPASPRFVCFYAPAPFFSWDDLPRETPRGFLCARAGRRRSPIPLPQDVKKMRALHSSYKAQLGPVSGALFFNSQTLLLGMIESASVR